MAQVEIHSLCIGDLISLRSVDFRALLCAEGILLSDLIVTENMREFDDCIFMVHLQRQYSASRELEAFLEVNKVEEAGS